MNHGRSAPQLRRVEQVSREQECERKQPGRANIFPSNFWAYKNKFKEGGLIFEDKIR